MGGTHARFARAEGGRPGEALTLRVAEHPRFDDALALARARLGAPPRFFCAVAGPVEAGRAALTNAPWVVEAAALPFAEVRLLNDLEAMAWALPALAPEEVEHWRTGTPVPEAPALVIAAGTGLGLAVRHAGGVTATEAGHAAFAPHDEEEEALLAHLRARQGPVSQEDLLSGEGLPRLAAALAALRRLPPPPASAAALAEAAARGEALPRAAIALFWRALGGFCGDAALMHGARGGVHLAGGALARLLPFCDRAAFLARFDAKPRMAGYLARIPVRRIAHPEPGLLGLAVLAATSSSAR
nr:glucokinase [Rubritepida flocculans]